MVQSESNTKTIIANILSQSRLESMSRLIRADAFQSFNYATREQMEGWLSEPDNVFEMDYNKWTNWQSVVDQFASDKFRNASVFAGFLANNLPSMIAQSEPEGYAGYEIDVEFDKETFTKILTTVLEQSAQDRDFFQIIGCDGTPENCPNGSFYLNLKFSKLDQSVYEQMPLVTVKDTRGNTTSSDPIIPKNDLKVYIPTRIFKALAIARGFMHSKLDSGMNTADDFGYYSPRIQNEIDSMALGYCDYGYCSPRQSPYFPPDTMYDDAKDCPGYMGSGSIPVNNVKFRGTDFSYPAGNDTDTEKEIKNLLIQRLCELSRELLGKYDVPENDNNFGMAGEGFLNGDPMKPCYVTVTNGDIDAESNLSKGVQMAANSSPIGMPDPFDTFDEEPNRPSESWAPCPYPYNLPTENQRTGMFLEGGEIKIKDYGEASCVDTSGTGIQSELKCTQITGVKLIITYVEKDLNYKVMKDRPVKIKISTYDHGYTPFNAKIDLGEYYPMDSSCVFSGSVAGAGTCRNMEGWMCYIPGGGITNGCYPSKQA
jgi:hypothetical protein